MEQRSLRLGDIVDDYCPRERRVTNHAIVALVGNSIKQTRCSTCEAEHEYKEAKVPRKRTRAGAPDADLSGGMLVVPKAAAPVAPMNEAEESPAAAAAASETNGAGAPEPESPADTGVPEENGGPGTDDQPPDNGWFSHRPLIRATLPKTDGEPAAPRVIPEFTMHQRHGRGFGGRNFRQHHQGHGNGPSRNGNNHFDNGNEPDGNRAPQAGRPGGGGRRRRRRRR